MARDGQIPANLVATLLLAALVGLAAFVNARKILIGTVATDGYEDINLDITYWNVACTIIGTVVGIFASVGFASRDDYNTRQELASSRRVVALFLRPLTVRRGGEQVLRRQLPLVRTLLVILTIAAALMSAATVALFSIRATRDDIFNPRASYPLGGSELQLFETSAKGAVFPVGQPSSNSHTSLLVGFLYKSAYITALKTKYDYVPVPNIQTAYIPSKGS